MFQRDASSSHSSSSISPVLGRIPTRVMLVVLMGLPAAGKTSLARVISQHGGVSWLPTSSSHDSASTTPSLPSSIDATAKVVIHHVCFDEFLHTLQPSSPTKDFPSALQPSSNFNSRDNSTDEHKSLDTPIVTPSTTSASESSSVGVTEVDIFDISAWKESRRAAIDHVNTLVHECVLSAKRSNVNNNEWHIILVDDNAHYRSMRHTMYQIAQQGTQIPSVLHASPLPFCFISMIMPCACEHNIRFSLTCWPVGCSYVIVYLRTSLTCAMARNNKRRGRDRVADVSVQRMASQLEEPNEHHIGDAHHTITINTDNLITSNDNDDKNALLDRSALHDSTLSTALWSSLPWHAIRRAWSTHVPPPPVDVIADAKRKVIHCHRHSVGDDR
jgi:tRNA uridine 5-carbamoylmethylation protein Kti12